MMRAVINRPTGQRRDASAKGLAVTECCNRLGVDCDSVGNEAKRPRHYFLAANWQSCLALSRVGLPTLDRPILNQCANCRVAVSGNGHGPTD
jgi:hypothetical protein